MRCRSCLRDVRCGIGGEGWRAGKLTRAVEFGGLMRRPWWRWTAESVSGVWAWIVSGLLLGRLPGCSFEGVVRLVMVLWWFMGCLACDVTFV